MMQLSPKDCIRTFTGIEINVFEPDPNLIRIEDIAHSLSHQCRFGGHLPKFYSVAQHSVLASKMVHPDYQLQALLHDASEAYLLDIPTPIKAKLNEYKSIEDKFMRAVADYYMFEYPLSEEVKKADRYMLEWEWSVLIKKEKSNYEKISCWSPLVAKRRFLKRYLEIKK